MCLAFRPIILAILAASATTATAQAPKPPAIEPEAKARLDALIAAYRALPAYADSGEVTLVVKVGDRELKQVQKASIAFARPNRLDVRTDLVRVVSDGSTITTSVSPLKKYQVAPAPKKLAESTLRGGPLGAIEFGGLAGLPLVHVLNLVLGEEPERLIFDFTPRVLAEPDRELDGISYRVLRLDESDNHDWRFLIDPRSGLLAFVELVVEGDALKSSIAGADTHVDSLRWAAGPIATGPPGSGAFAAKPEPGFRQVGKIEGVPAAGAGPPAEGHTMVGKPAPDFTLDVLDGPDRVRKVGRADLLGKVVVLDFWATWCAPCLVELPEVQKLIEGYGRSGKGVVVAAVSIDRVDDGDIREVRSKVEATLRDRKLNLTNGVGLVALDPLNTLADLFSVDAVPFLAVIDAGGVVRAVHVGPSDPSTLAEEVDALLAGRAIRPEKPGR